MIAQPKVLENAKFFAEAGQMNMQVKAIRISDAARLLNVGSLTLFKQLRANRIFNGKLPRSAFVDKGYFHIEYREYTLPGTKIQKPYAIALVTAKGMTLLQDVVHTAEAKKQTVH